MIYLILTIGLILIDQITKIITLKQLAPIGSVTIIENFLSFTYVENRGAAFGIMQNSRIFFLIFTVILIGAIIYYTIKTKQNSKFYLISTSLIIAGGIGNFIDRLFRGYVVDMIEVTFISYPVFNFADICIVIGAILFCVYMLFSKPENTEK